MGATTMARHTAVPTTSIFLRARQVQCDLSTRAHILTILRLAAVVLVGLGCMWLAASVGQAIFTIIIAQQTAPTAVAAPFAESNQTKMNQRLVTVAVGGTQSYADTAITIDNLRIVTAQGAIGAPGGEAFAIVTVTLRNLDPAHPQVFNAADFVLQNAAGSLNHPAFTALDDPLMTGTLGPNGTTTGDLAFLVPYPVADSVPDPEIEYLPSAISGATLSWSVPLAPLLP